MKKIKFITLISVFLLLLGCGAITVKMESVTPNFTDYSYTEGKFKNNISEVVFEPQKLGGQPIVFSNVWSEWSKTNNGRILQDNYRKFEAALKKGIENAGLYSSQGLYKLNVEEITETLPVAGADMLCLIKIRYVVESKSGVDIFDEIVETEFVSKWNDSFIGVERSKIACHGAFRKNFEVVIDRLVHAY